MTTPIYIALYTIPGRSISDGQFHWALALSPVLDHSLQERIMVYQIAWDIAETSWCVDHCLVRLVN